MRHSGNAESQRAGRTPRLCVAAAVIGVIALAGTAAGQPARGTPGTAPGAGAGAGGGTGAGARGTVAQRAAASPQRQNMQRMTRLITIELEDQRLEDVITFIEEFTGAELDPLWRTDVVDGLDREARVTMRARNLPALTFLERVLEQAQTGFQQNQWQMTEWGTIEFGPKDRLNRRKRMVVYDINDLLLELPRYYDAPEVDLQTVLQSAQGGGQSPFRDDQQQRRTPEEQERLRQDRVEQITQIITQFVESDQWQENGGDGGSIRYFQGALYVNAADYMHRQLGGYPWWPARQVVRTENGRRYVSLSMDTGVSKVDGFATQPVTGTAGGGGGDGGPPGGGG